MGMMDQAQQAAQPMPAKQGSQFDPHDASPEEQQAFEQAMGAMTDTIYNEQISQEIIGMVVGEEDAISGFAKAIVMIVTEVDNKIDIPEEIIFGVAENMVDLIVELVETGVGEDLVDEKQMQQIGGAVVDMLSESYDLGDEQTKAELGQYAESRRGEIEGVRKNLLGE